MRFAVLKALVVKEARRHVANRGGVVLCALLVVAALLLSVFNPGTGGGGTGGGSLVDGVHRCLVQYADESAVVKSLKQSVPPDLRPHVTFERRAPGDVKEMVTYPPGTGAIQLRTRPGADGRGVLHVAVWHPPENPAAMAPYEAWLWRALRLALQDDAAARLRAAGADPAGLTAPDPGADDLWAVRDSLRQFDAEVLRLAPAPSAGSAPVRLPAVELTRTGLGAKELDLRSAVAMGMVVFALYFFCVYLLPTMTCEERERGVLLAQALSPASPAEILAAKFLFYPVLGILLAAVVAGIYKPAVLSSLFFWLTLAAVGAGFLGIGMTIATLAKTQRAAFMGSMCYLLSVALVLFICQQNSIPGVPYLAVEYHGPRAVHAAITQEVNRGHWLNLLGAGGLGACWMLLAGRLFRRRGWQ